MSHLELESNVRLPVVLTKGSVAFVRCHEAVTPAMLFSVDPQGDRQVSVGESGVSGGIGTSGSFGMVARPLGFLKCQVETASLRCQGNTGIPFNEAVKWTLISK